LLLGHFIPRPTHPELNGEYQVGVDSIEIISEQDNKKIPIKIWFPIEDKKIDVKSLSASTWTDYPKIMSQEIAERAGLPSFMFSHLKHFTAGHSTPFSPINHPKATQKPLIVLVHGRGGFKALNTFMALELASQGYIVIAPDIPGGAMMTVLENGSKISFDSASFAEDKEYSEDEKLRIIQILGNQWKTDISQSIDVFKRKYPLLKNNTVIASGHSTGAAAAINYCQTSPDCIGNIALDAWMKPVTISILENGSKKPILALFGDQSSNDFEPINQERFNQLQTSTINQGVKIQNIEIKQARHLDFCDAALLSPFSYLLGQQKGKIDTHIVMQTINTESLKFIATLNP